MKKLLIGIVILAAVLIAADFGLKLYSQSVVANEIRASLDLSENPSVSFGGWPFTPHLFTGDLPSATVTADELSSHGLKLEHVTLTLHDIHFPPKRLLSGGGGIIHAERGEGTARFTGADVTAALREAGVPATVTIGDGRASLESHGIKVGLDIKLSQGGLVLTPAAVSIASVHVDLPPIVHGLQYTSVVLDGSEAVVSFKLRNVSFLVPAES